MKITISFEKEEKTVLTDMMCSISEVKEVVDKDNHYVGKFGEYKNNKESNEFVLNLNTEFVKASAGLMTSYFNIIKAFVENYMTFLVSWFSDVKDLNEDNEIAGLHDIPRE